MTTYNIYTLSDLQNMSADLAGTYYLKANIDCSATSTWNSGAGFLPIGSTASRFTGSFYGGNYELSNLFINTSSADAVGLFGASSGSTFDKVKLISVNMTANSSTAIGALVGNARSSTISDCFASGTVSGNNRVGGLIGQSPNGFPCTISRCWASVTVAASGAWGGGLIGDLNAGTMIDCYAEGGVTGGSQNGGLIGTMGGSTNTPTVTNCYARGTVSASSYAGGLIGIATRASGTANLKNCYATGPASATNKGGLIGLNSLTTPITITNCWWYNVVDTLGVGSGSGTGATKASGTTDFYSSSFTVYTGTPAWDTTVWRWVTQYPKLGVLNAPLDINFDSISEELPLGTLGTIIDILTYKYGTDLLCQEYDYVAPVVYEPLDILSGYGLYDRLVEEIPPFVGGETSYGFVS